MIGGKSLALGATARWAVIVTVAFLAIHGRDLREHYKPNTWLFRDNAFYYLTTVTLAEHGRLEQRAFQPVSWYARDLGWNRFLPDDWSNVALGRNGGWYPKHPIVLPVLAVPFYWLLGTVGTLVLNVGLNLAFILLIFLLARRIARLPVAALAAVAISSMPFVRDMSYSFSNDLLSGVLILGALEATLAGWLGWAGILAGLSIWSRVTNLAVLPGLILVGYSVGGRRAVRRAVLFSLLPLGAFAVFNTWLFGAPWVTTYGNVLVRENGVMKTASHVHHFNVPFAAGLHDMLLGQEGAFHTLPLLAPGLVGLVVLLRRRFLVASGLLLCCVLPALAYAKYDFFRPHFLYPAFGLAGVGLAALVSVVLPKPAKMSERTWHLPRWPIWAAGGALLVAAVGWRLTTRPDPALLSSHVREARVWLDDVPCDYWNIQVERWECSHLDGDGWAMTGKLLEPEPVDGVLRAGLWMHPSPTRRTKRMVFRQLDAHRVDLSFALSDLSHPGPVEISIVARGQAPVELQLTRPGEEQYRVVELAEGAGPALELRVHSRWPDWKHLIVEGRLQ